jgi:hypothetical protein
MQSTCTHHEAKYEMNFYLIYGNHLDLREYLVPCNQYLKLLRIVKHTLALHAVAYSEKHHQHQKRYHISFLPKLPFRFSYV